MNDNVAAEQLALIAEVTRLLTGTGIAHWLIGGWALDFLACRPTRAHDDIDMFAWRRDVVAIRQLLIGHGYDEKVAGHPEESAYFAKHGHWVDFTLLERDEQGRIAVAGRFRDWLLPAASFNGPPAQYQGVACPVLDAAGQWLLKTEFHRQPAGGPPRAKDIGDMEILRGLLSATRS